MRYQKKIIGRRRMTLSSALSQEIKNQIERESIRYGVSKSFVIANACAFAFNIPVESFVTKDETNVVSFRKSKRRTG